MLGRQHLMLSAATAIPFLIYLLDAPSLSAIFFIGICIGSLIPDVDVKNSTIFHRKIRGLRFGSARIFNSFLTPIFPLFGYITRYLIYIPAIKTYNLFLPKKYCFNCKHRNFSHCLIGISTITAATGLIAYLALQIFNISNIFYVKIFLASYFAGSLLHLIQDSCTNSGIAWMQPFSSRKISGKIKTGENDLEANIFLLQLGTITLFSLYFSLNIVQILSVIVGSWTLFLFTSGVKLE